MFTLSILVLNHQEIGEIDRLHWWCFSDRTRLKYGCVRFDIESYATNMHSQIRQIGWIYYAIRWVFKIMLSEDLGVWVSDFPEGKLKLFEVGKRFNKWICGLFNMIQVMNYYVGICFLGGFRLATSMLVTKCVGYNFGILITDFKHVS